MLRLLHRIAGEGWIERQPGYGWKFVETVSSADAYLQANRYRMLIEPAGILEAEFKLNRSDADRIRAAAGARAERRAEDLHARRAVSFRLRVSRNDRAGAGNPFLLDSLKRVNSLRRLFSYRRVLPDHASIARQAREHLQLLDLLEADRRREAADYMAWHLKDTIGARED